MDREVQGQVRHGLGRLPRGDAGAAEEARRRAAGKQAQCAIAGPARPGFARAGSEAALRANDGGLRRVRCELRLRDGVDAVKQMPDADNTIFIYIAGDNGSSAEGGLEGSVNENLFFNGFTEKWRDNLK